MKKFLSVLFISLTLLTTCLGQGIALDKISHFSMGYVIGATTTNLLEQHIGKQKAILIGCGTSIITGIAKEVVYDKLLRRGTPEFDDVTATLLGGISGSIIITINF